MHPTPWCSWLVSLQYDHIDTAYFILSHKTNFKDSAGVWKYIILKALLCKLCTSSLKENYHHPKFGLVGGNWSCTHEKKPSKLFRELMDVFFHLLHFIFPLRKRGPWQWAFSQFPVPGSNSVPGSSTFLTISFSSWRKTTCPRKRPFSDIRSPFPRIKLHFFNLPIDSSDDSCNMPTGTWSKLGSSSPYILHPWRWQRVPPECLYPFTRLHSVTT